MTTYHALRKKPSIAPYKPGDILVLFGELFSRGYANGLVEEAERLGMQIITATVGRREKDGGLRPLNDEEITLATTSQKILINVPLEAGFDLEPSEIGPAPVDMLKDLKLSNWMNAQMNSEALEASRKKGAQRFKQNVESFMNQLTPLIKPGKNVVFAHLMAGGVPRTKIVMPLMNRVFKGRGDRFLASQEFWESPIGKFCETSFKEVTAETFRHLMDHSTPLKDKIEAAGGHVSYVAYGYHGTEVYLSGEYKWQTYTPYLQGWAKRNLEEISREYSLKNYNCCVYNCPEILTNSSSIFQGVEVCLYPLVKALTLDAPTSARTATTLTECQSLLKDGYSLNEILDLTNAYSKQPVILDHCQFNQWPQHSSREQMELMLEFSEKLVEMHIDPKKLITSILSEVVFDSCGYVMLHDSWQPKAPVSWINHDLVARCLT
jgi:hypothetical protein